MTASNLWRSYALFPRRSRRSCIVDLLSDHLRDLKARNLILYRVNVKHGCKDTAYYTNDLEIRTPEAMVDLRTGN